MLGGFNHQGIVGEDLPQDGSSMICKKLKMLPVECIVRGYITGSGWASYKKDGTVCGIKLPDGLRESEKLPEPIYTPSTKGEIGEHDENISSSKIGERRVGKECRSRWSPYH